MKVISIGMGQNIFEEESAIRQRQIQYGNIFDELHLVVFTPDNHKFENQKLSNNVFLYPSKSKIRALYLFDFLKIVKKIISERGRNDIVISCQDPFETGVVGLFAKLIYKLPLQVQLHTDFHNRYFILHSPLNLIRFVIAQVVLSFADSARVVSLRIAKSIGSLSENVSVLPIYTETVDRRQETADRSKDKIIFLTVARLEKEKDIPTIIKAFAKTLEDGIDAELIIVGDGSQKKELENLSRILNLESRIHFAGWQNDLSSYYQKADVYVSSSLYEGYGMSVVEAASHGCALVLSDTGVAGEIFHDSESALVCKQKDTERFAKAFKLLAQNADFRRKLGEKAAEATQLIKLEPQEYERRYQASVLSAAEYYRLEKGIFSRNILLRYLVSGLTAAASNILLFYFLTYPFGVYYLYSSIIAYWLSFIVSFALQKFWTFRDKSIDKVHRQFIKYALVVLLGVGVNTVCMYMLVDLAHIWPVVAQILTGAVIAMFNFFAYKLFIFKQ